MELEAANWWLQSIGYDFDGKKNIHQKILFFLVDFFSQKKIKTFSGKKDKFRSFFLRIFSEIFLNENPITGKMLKMYFFENQKI